MKNDNPRRLEHNSPPRNLSEAYDRFYALIGEVNTIEAQLQDSNRSKNFAVSEDYNHWRKKANIALSMKLKQIENLKKWINENNGEVPTEEHDNVKPENMSIGNNARIDSERRPDPDRIIDNLCGSIMQMRSLKRRLYPFYKIANAAFDLAQELGIDTDDPQDVLNQMVYWLDKAGYNIKEISGFSQNNDIDDGLYDNDIDDWDD